MAINTNVTPIAPTNHFKVLNNVPLDLSYDNTIKFSNGNEQLNYFNSKVYKTFENFGLVKLQNKVRVPCNANLILDCNYCMFMNSEWQDKWFYAFITDIEYVNPNMCYVTFQIDVLQTWMFAWVLGDSFVEREHVADDTIGHNTEPENLELGDLICNQKWQTGKFTSWKICVASMVQLGTTPGTIVPQYGQIYNGVYCGASFYLYNTDTESVAQLNRDLTELNNVNALDNIIAIYMAPADFFNTPQNYKFDLELPKHLSDVDGYVPRNNKLLTYPFNFLTVTNFSGNSAVYKYELFSNTNNFQYELSGDIQPNASFAWTPRNYKGQPIMYSEALTLTGLPLCSFTSDTYRAWLAMNQSSLQMANVAVGTQIVGGAASTVIGAISGNPIAAGAGISAVGSGIMGALNNMAKVTDAEAVPNHVKGNQVNNLMYSNGVFDFGMYCMSIKAEYARSIDDYFDMFGYKVNRVKRPNITGRPYWNYIKTNGCNISGNIFADHITLIKSIFNKGVTFWHDSDVGNYGRLNK